MNGTYSQLCINLDRLKLNQMKEKLDVTLDFITKNSISFTEGLLKLSNYEVDRKETNASKAMIKAGAFPYQKGIESFEFAFQPSINEEQIYDFTTLRFLEKQENIVFLGSSVVGKTHLATAVGIAAAKKMTSTYFIKSHELLQQLKRSKLENRLEARLKHFSKYRLNH